MATPARRMMTAGSAVLIGLSVAVLAGCAAGAPVKPFESAQSTHALERDETGLWFQAQEFDEYLQHTGALLDDPLLDSYLQGVVDKLFPEFQGALRVRVFHSTVPNAFVIPNGSIYMDLGMLVQLDNEAQLAAILGHEGSHFIQRHQLKSTRTAKQSMAWGSVFGVAIAFPDLGNLLAYSSVMGYSRDLERQADEDGFRRMRDAGYDVGESVVVFERLARHSQYMEYKRPVFFASHPRMEERVDSFEEMIAGASAGGELGEEIYLERTAGAMAEYLEDEVQRGNHKALLFMLEEEDRLEAMPPGHRYYLGEAYRLKGEEGDLQVAEVHYRQTIADAPETAAVYAALGKLLMKQGKNEEAAQNFRHYLVLSPDAPDRAYIESYLARLEQGEH